jgi:mannose-6-phosphate isomerase class I
MKLQKRRWSKVYESTEEELVALLDSRNITAARHDIEAFTSETIQPQVPSGSIWCAEGSCTVRISDATTSLQPGDYLPIDAGSKYIIEGGISGCVYYV